MTEGRVILARLSPANTFAWLFVFGGFLTLAYLAPLAYDSWEAFYDSSSYASAWPYMAAVGGPLYLGMCVLMLRNWLIWRGAAIVLDGRTLAIMSIFVLKVDLDELASVEPGKADNIVITRRNGRRNTKSVWMMQGSRDQIVEKIRAVLPTEAGGAGGAGESDPIAKRTA